MHAYVAPPSVFQEHTVDTTKAPFGLSLWKIAYVNK